jgi:hypothetical protein
VLVAEAELDVPDEEEVDAKLDVSDSIEVGIELEVEDAVLVLLVLVLVLVASVVPLPDPVLLDPVAVVAAEPDEVASVLVSGVTVSTAMLMVDCTELLACVACAVVVVVDAASLSPHRKSTMSPEKRCPIMLLPSACCPAHRRCTNTCEATKFA